MTTHRSNSSLTRSRARPLRIGLVVPHIFMQDALLGDVIFSPGDLALALADGLTTAGAQVSLYSPGAVTTKAKNINADMTLFEQELAGRGYGYIELLKKHPLTFVSLARQVQAELIAQAFADANQGKLDIVHIYTNEEDIALPFTQFCAVPVVYTHHDPFRLLIRYKNTFPKYRHLNWVSLSYAQRQDMPADTNWVANIYHGLDASLFAPVPAVVDATGPYVVFLGRIIESKGTHLAIAAVQHYNRQHPRAQLCLKIAGRHYAGTAKDTYWQDKIRPLLGGPIEYLGPVNSITDKQALLGNALAALMPSTFHEPFGMVAIESMACATPVIGLDGGALPEVIGADGGIVVPMIKRLVDERDTVDEAATVEGLTAALERIHTYDRTLCRKRFLHHFTLDAMCNNYVRLYQQLAD